jgi:hypothetical protein
MSQGSNQQSKSSNPSRSYIAGVSMAVADFTQLEIFANMIATGAALCITANSLPMLSSSAQADDPVIADNE